MENKDDRDIIVAYLLGNIDKLSKALTERLERLYAFDAAIRLYGDRHKVIKLMLTKYKHEYEGERAYSQRLATADYEACEYIFGTSMKHNREYHVSIALAKINQTWEVAKINGNPAAMARCDQNRMMLIEKFMGTKDTPLYDELKIPTQIFTADPKALGMAEMPDEAKLQAEMEKLRASPRTHGSIDISYQEAEEDD